MLYFAKRNLVFLANPKTASSSVERALHPHATMVVSNPPGLRHMNMAEYRRHIEPLLKRHKRGTPRVFVVLRDPVARLLSWYRYRTRASAAKAGGHDTSALTAEDFLRETLKEAPRPFARIGRQTRFVGLEQGLTPPDHIFPLEYPGPLNDFLTREFGAVTLERVNTSPPDLSLVDADLIARVRAHRHDEVALYRRVLAAHGIAEATD